MELSLTTFILEIVNFLVLVWILKRLFFVPIKRVIEARKASVSKTLKDAHDLKGQADQLRLQYEGRLKEWEAERAKALVELERSLSEEKIKRLAQIEASLEAERAKMRAQEERKSADAKGRLEHEAMKQSMEFTSRLLLNLVSSELEEKIIKIALGSLNGLRSSALGAPGSASGSKETVCVVRTAFAPSSAQRMSIQGSIESEIGSGIKVQFATDVALLAGIEVVLGGTVVRANLRDELSYFSEAGR